MTRLLAALGGCIAGGLGGRMRGECRVRYVDVAGHDRRG